MLLNYIKIAFRNIIRNSFYSFISITGLAVGITASALILLFVSHEYSFDRFHKNGSAVYRILSTVRHGDQQFQFYRFSTSVGPKIKEGLPEIADYVRIRPSPKAVIQSNADHRFFENQFLFVDPSFFRVFSFDIVRGNPVLLERTNTVMLTERTAKKYFADADPVGQTLSYNKENIFEVVGIIKDSPSNSSLQFDFVASFSSLGTISSEKNIFIDDKASAYITYLQFRPGSSTEKTRNLLPVITHRKDAEYTFEPVTEMHLGKHSDTSNNRNINIFLFVAILILLLALLSYVNLTTARAATRAKEIGIRKTMGAKRGALTIQFYVESTLMTFIAFSLAFVLIEILTPIFLTALQQNIDAAFLRSTLFLAVTASLLVVCVFLSGSYPSIVLSQFKPVDALKGKLNMIRKDGWLRHGFTVCQFSVSIALIICCLAVQGQLEYMRTKEIGLNKEQVMAIPFNNSLNRNLSAFKNDVRRQSGVVSVATASISLYEATGTAAFTAKTPITHEDIVVNMMTVDEAFFHTLGLEFVGKETDSIAAGDFVINEAALEKLKVGKEYLGKELDISGESAIVRGIVKDFNYLSLREKVEGIVLTVAKDSVSSWLSPGGTVYVRLLPNASLGNNVEVIKNIYARYQPETPFQYYFLDDSFDKLYKSEDRLLLMFQVFTGIAIFIACLSLYGLVTFSTEQRTKEIGIRKVSGASTGSILQLLSKRYFLLVGISLLIASPIAWWSMDRWLANFNYRIDLSVMYVVYAGVAAFFIAMITVSFKAIKAALRNPVDALRSE